MLYIRTAALYMKSIEQTQKIQEEENREKNKKENQQHINYKRERAKKNGERIASLESPCPRPIKKSPTKRSNHLNWNYPNPQKSSKSCNT